MKSVFLVLPNMTRASINPLNRFHRKDLETIADGLLTTET